MKRIHAVAIAVICICIGWGLSSFRTAQAQSGQVGRFQLYQGKSFVGDGVGEMNQVYRLDTLTGKTDHHLQGTNKAGKLIDTWTPID